MRNEQRKGEGDMAGQADAQEGGKGGRSDCCGVNDCWYHGPLGHLPNLSMRELDTRAVLGRLLKLWQQQGTYTKGLCPGNGRHNYVGADCPACEAWAVLESAAHRDPITGQPCTLEYLQTNPLTCGRCGESIPADEYRGASNPPECDRCRHEAHPCPHCGLRAGLHRSGCPKESR